MKRLDTFLLTLCRLLGDSAEAMAVFWKKPHVHFLPDFEQFWGLMDCTEAWSFVSVRGGDLGGRLQYQEKPNNAQVTGRCPCDTEPHCPESCSSKPCPGYLTSHKRSLEQQERRTFNKRQEPGSPELRVIPFSGCMTICVY